VRSSLNWSQLTEDREEEEQPNARNSSEDDGCAGASGQHKFENKRLILNLDSLFLCFPLVSLSTIVLFFDGFFTGLRSEGGGA